MFNMSSKIIAYKISDKLYRVKNPRGVVKDVWILKNKIQEPTNQYNILTDTEKEIVLSEVKKQNK